MEPVSLPPMCNLYRVTSMFEAMRRLFAVRGNGDQQPRLPGNLPEPRRPAHPHGADRRARRLAGAIGCSRPGRRRASRDQRPQSHEPVLVIAPPAWEMQRCSWHAEFIGSWLQAILSMSSAIRKIFRARSTREIEVNETSSP